MQHDHHINARALYALEQIIKVLFAPAELGWNEWYDYASAGEWC
jgi:hypothetical protein